VPVFIFGERKLSQKATREMLVKSPPPRQWRKKERVMPYYPGGPPHLLSVIQQKLSQLFSHLRLKTPFLLFF